MIKIEDLDQNQEIYYFAYGSNINPKRCHGRLQQAGCEILDEHIVKLDNYRLTFDKINPSGEDRGFANIEVDNNDHVIGVAYKMKRKGLKVLDGFEGVDSKQYYRDHVIVDVFNPENQQFESGNQLICNVYMACEDAKQWGYGRKPTSEYLSHLLARKGEMPDYYQKKLENIPCIDCEVTGGNDLVNS